MINLPECGICLGSVSSSGEHRPTVLTCAHTFCFRCVKQFNPTKCPYCREHFNSEKVKDNFFAIILIKNIENHNNASRQRKINSTNVIQPQIDITYKLNSLFTKRLNHFVAECSNMTVASIKADYNLSAANRDVKTAKQLVRLLLKTKPPVDVVDMLLKSNFSTNVKLKKILKNSFNDHPDNIASSYIDLNNQRLVPALLIFAEKADHNTIASITKHFDLERYKLTNMLSILRKLSDRCTTMNELFLCLSKSDKENFKKIFSENSSLPILLETLCSPTFHYPIANHENAAHTLKENDYPEETGITGKPSEININQNSDNSIKGTEALTCEAEDNLANIPLRELKNTRMNSTIVNIERVISVYWHQSTLNREKFKAVFVPGNGDSDNINSPDDFIRETNLTLETFKERCINVAPFFDILLYAANNQPDEKLPVNIKDVRLYHMSDKTLKMDKHVFSKITSNLCSSLEKHTDLSLVIMAISTTFCINISETDENDFGAIVSALINRGMTIGGLTGIIYDFITESDIRNRALKVFIEEVTDLHRQLKEINPGKRKPSAPKDQTPDLPATKKLKLSDGHASNTMNHVATRNNPWDTNNSRLMDNFSNPARVKLAEAFCFNATKSHLVRLSRRYNIQHLVHKDGSYNAMDFLKYLSMERVTANELLEDIKTEFTQNDFADFKKEMSSVESPTITKRSNPAKTTDKLLIPESGRKPQAYEGSTNAGKKAKDLTIRESFPQNKLNHLSKWLTSYLPLVLSTYSFEGELCKQAFITNPTQRDNIESLQEINNIILEMTPEQFIKVCENYRPYFNSFLHCLCTDQDLQDEISDTALYEIKEGVLRKILCHELLRWYEEIDVELINKMAITVGIDYLYCPYDLGFMVFFDHFAIPRGVTIGNFFKALDLLPPLMIASVNNVKKKIKRAYRKYASM